MDDSGSEAVVTTDGRSRNAPDPAAIARSLANLGKRQAQAGDDLGAILTFAAALIAGGATALPVSWLARLCLRIDSRPAALHYCRLLGEIEPGNADAFMDGSRIAALLGEADEADRMLAAGLGRLKGGRPDGAADAG